MGMISNRNQNKRNFELILFQFLFYVEIFRTAVFVLSIYRRKTNGMERKHVLHL